MQQLSREQKLTAHLALLSQRSTCLRGQVSALIVKDKRVISEGYNGSPPNMPHCLDAGCLTDHRPVAGTTTNEQVAIEGCARTIHAEANALAFAARYGVAVDGCEMWCTHAPCGECAKLIVSAGLVKLTYLKDYRLGRQDLLDDAGLEVVQYGVAG